MTVKEFDSAVSAAANRANAQKKGTMEPQYVYLGGAPPPGAHAASMPPPEPIPHPAPYFTPKSGTTSHQQHHQQQYIPKESHMMMDTYYGQGVGAFGGMDGLPQTMPFMHTPYPLFGGMEAGMLGTLPFPGIQPWMFAVPPAGYPCMAGMPYMGGVQPHFPPTAPPGGRRGGKDGGRGGGKKAGGDAGAAHKNRRKAKGKNQEKAAVIAAADAEASSAASAKAEEEATTGGKWFGLKLSGSNGAAVVFASKQQRDAAQAKEFAKLSLKESGRDAAEGVVPENKFTKIRALEDPSKKAKDTSASGAAEKKLKTVPIRGLEQKAKTRSDFLYKDLAELRVVEALNLSPRR